MQLWSEFKVGLVAGIKPFGPAFRLLFVTMLTASALLLFGAATILIARESEETFQRLLMLASEGLVLSGALVVLGGCVRSWWLVIQAGFPGGR